MLEVDAMGQPVVVEDLDADWLLALLEEKKTAAREAERAKLRLAAQWCVLHPATADTGVATWAGDALPGVLHQDESLGGEGTPAVSAFAPEPVAAALGVSTLTGMKLIADALDLQHRLPRIWRLVEDLAVEPWKARQVAQATHALSQAAAAYVDEQLAPKLRLVRVRRDPDRGRDGDRQVPPRAPRADGRSRAARVGTSPCGTPPPATSTAPATSTWPATPST